MSRSSASAVVTHLIALQCLCLACIEIKWVEHYMIMTLSLRLQLSWALSSLWSCLHPPRLITPLVFITWHSYFSWNIKCSVTNKKINHKIIIKDLWWRSVHWEIWRTVPPSGFTLQYHSMMSVQVKICYLLFWREKDTQFVIAGSTQILYMSKVLILIPSKSPLHWKYCKYIL